LHVATLLVVGRRVEQPGERAGGHPVFELVGVGRVVEKCV
jgi:hypothetical protein